VPIPGSNSPIINLTNLVMTITINEVNGSMSCVTNRPIPHLQAIAILAAIIQAQVQDSLETAAKGANALLNPNNNPANNPPGGNIGN
jgi:hypothetical protein